MIVALLPSRFLRSLRDDFRNRGHDIRFVGGCVRDALAGLRPKDIDLCTNATPDQQIAIYRKAGLRFVAAPSALAHGTVTVIDPDTREPHEITTLRVDEVCDGRHAEVSFTDDWHADLARRDLTFNAMTVDFDGKLYDPFGGAEDLKQGRVRFVGDAEQRIREDYLRILRFYRFLGRFGLGSKVDFDTDCAIRMNARSLEKISVERIWSEMSRILAHPSRLEVLRDMDQGTYVLNALKAILRPHKVESSNPITQLVANFPDAVELTQRWKMSLDEQRLAEFLHRRRSGPVDYRFEAAVSRTSTAWLLELAALRGEDSGLVGWDVPVCPISGDDVIAAGYKPGKLIGEMLGYARERWAASGFTLDKDELIAGLNPVGYRKLFPHEIETTREQKRLANEAAQAELDRRGHRGVHPRVAEARARGADI